MNKIYLTGNLKNQQHMYSLLWNYLKKSVIMASCAQELYSLTSHVDSALTGRVWINGLQYFDSVPVITWEFYIGAYQLAQKWLKDRHGRELSF